MVTTPLAERAARDTTRFIVTKQFTDGVLKDMTGDDRNYVGWHPEVGWVCKPWAYGSGYIVLAVRPEVQA